MPPPPPHTQEIFEKISHLNLVTVLIKFYLKMHLNVLFEYMTALITTLINYGVSFVPKLYKNAFFINYNHTL